MSILQKLSRSRAIALARMAGQLVKDVTAVGSPMTSGQAYTPVGGKVTHLSSASPSQVEDLQELTKAQIEKWTGQPVEHPLGSEPVKTHRGGMVTEDGGLQKQERVYLLPGEEPPRGAQAQVGPRGGRFYITTPEMITGVQEEVPESQREFEISGKVSDEVFDRFSSWESFSKRVKGDPVLEQRVFSSVLAGGDALAEIDGEEVDFFVAWGRGNLQGLVTYRIQTEEGVKGLVVSHLASAPWNFKGSPSRRAIRGIGTGLMLEVVKRALKEGVGVISLDPFEGARDFYLKLGFKQAPEGFFEMDRGAMHKLIADLEGAQGG